MGPAFSARVPVAQRKKHPPAKTNGETRTGYEPGPGALSRERRASPPKYRAGTVSPLITATLGRQRPGVCGLFVGLREHDREFVVHAGDDPRVLMIEVKSARNPKASGP